MESIIATVISQVLDEDRKQLEKELKNNTCEPELTRVEKTLNPASKVFTPLSVLVKKSPVDAVYEAYM